MTNDKQVEYRNWEESKKFIGIWRGKKTAHVVDVNLGGQLVVKYGRWSSFGCRKVVNVSEFEAWIKENKAKWEEL